MRRAARQMWRPRLSRLGELGRRALRRVQSTLRGRRSHIVYHRGYEVPIPGIPLDPLRAQRVVAYLLDEGFLQLRDLTTPIPASLDNISLVHTPEYLERLDRPDTMTSVLGFSTSTDAWQRWIDVQRLMTGGTIQATRLALKTGCVAVNLGGGLHHAGPDRGAGFCVINDVAVAVARLQYRGFRERVLVVDLDIHDGNGTRAAFSEDSSVHTFSVHNETWDDSSAVQDTQIALGADVTDEDYLGVIEKELPAIITRFRPGLIIYVAGVDPAHDDGLGDWRISEQGLLTRDRLVYRLAREEGQLPLVVVLGGGYGDHAWRYSARFFAWLFSGREVNPREDIDAIVRRFRRIESEESGRAQGGEESDWKLSQDDLMLDLGRTVDTRLFGHYTKHGLELQLERLGILNQIRARGFTSPTLVLDSISELGQTARLFGDADRTELLMELRARRDRTALPDMELLYVEWLLLQNPRRDFTVARPRLPGQGMPGLGLLREVVALLVVVCEQAGLDGIMFVPAHYYMAALGRRHLRFIRAEDSAIYEAMRAVLGDLDLATATQAIESGRLINPDTGQPVLWHTPKMILPVSRRLASLYKEKGETAKASGAAEGPYRLSDYV